MLGRGNISHALDMARQAVRQPGIGRRRDLPPATPLNVNSLAVGIITYNRPTSINRAIREWMASTPDSVPIVVISNHSRIELDRDYGPRLHVLMNTLRPDYSSGYLTRNWNQLFIQLFAEHDWVVCSQDDVTVRPGWTDRILAETPRDLYVAPQGDVVFCMNRAAFRRVGWFDERFTQIGSHEFDYWFRAMRELGPERISFYDGLHGWSRGGNAVNPIGLEDFWKSTFRDNERYRDWVPMPEINLAHWVDKWGRAPRLDWSFAFRRKRLREIDWYPWFSQRIAPTSNSSLS